MFSKSENYAENLSNTQQGCFGQLFFGNVQFQLLAKIERVHISEQTKLIFVEKFIVF